MLEQSYGILPAQIIEGRWFFFLVEHQAGHIAFPKGHKEEGESSYEAAVRELKEETNLDIKVKLSETVFQENYTYKRQGRQISKQVDYFLCLVEGEVSCQIEEIKSGNWLPLEKIKEKITFREGKKLVDELTQFLNTQSK